MLESLYKKMGFKDRHVVNVTKLLILGGIFDTATNSYSATCQDLDELVEKIHKSLKEYLLAAAINVIERDSINEFAKKYRLAFDSEIENIGIEIKMLHFLTQALFLRPEGTERHDLTDEKYASKRELLLDVCTKLGFINALRPNIPLDKTSCILLLGTLQHDFEHRINYAKTIDGFEKHPNIYLLAGNRPLWVGVEGAITDLLVGIDKEIINSAIEDSLAQFPEDSVSARDNRQQFVCEKLGISHWPTETQMIEKCTLNHGIKHFTLIDAEGKNGKRPNTADTVEAFYKLFSATADHTKHCDILIVSSQPDGLYQANIVAAYLPKNFTVHIAACDVEHQSLATIFDDIAKMFHSTVMNQDNEYADIEVL